MKIAFIGFGEAARAVTDSLKGKGEAEFVAAFDLKQDEDMAAEVRSRGLRFVRRDPSDCRERAFPDLGRERTHR